MEAHRRAGRLAAVRPVAHGQISGHCLGVVCQTLAVLGYRFEAHRGAGKLGGVEPVAHGLVLLSREDAASTHEQRLLPLLRAPDDVPAPRALL